ncbi:MAG: sugar kinase [Thermoguttaceae bacterium]|nr:sugar kinase [Thermoguttaceae bacterium]MBQ6620886.1 sugar kinase [Thermoguttaceae bacterium]
MSVVITGSAGIDTVETPVDRRERVMGGSAMYISAAASFFTPVALVSVVGEDWPRANTEILRGRGVDTTALEIRQGEKTLYWFGRYHGNMDECETVEIQPNVFSADFIPAVPAKYRKGASVVLLGNASPTTQMALLDQVPSRALTLADTMNYYINGQRPALERLLKRIDVLVLNESELFLLTEENALVAAIEKALTLGPKVLVVKRGTCGVILATAAGQKAILPAYPMGRVVDPTGAGDSFLGGLGGSLAAVVGPGRLPSIEEWKSALLNATLIASFCIESFSLERLLTLVQDEFRQRREEFVRMLP